MSETLYYHNTLPDPQFDGEYLDQLSGFIAQAAQQLSPVHINEALQFGAEVLIASGSQSAVETGAVVLTYIDSSRVQVGDTIYPISALFDAGVQVAISNYLTNILKAEFVAAGILAINTEPHFLAIVGIGVGVTHLYSKYVNPITEPIFDMLSGTVDTHLQLKNESGQVISGVKYFNGLSSSELPAAAEQLLIKSAENFSYPISPTQVHTIEVVYGAETAGFSDVFTVYDGAMAERAAEIFWAGNVSDFNHYISNDLYYVDTEAFGETRRWVFARTAINGSSVNYNETLDMIAVPADQGEFAAQFFHPRNIYFAENGHFNVNLVDDQPRLYLGDSADSTSVFAAHAGIGDDRMYGGGGDDALYGDVGDDRIYGDFGAQASEQAYAYHYGDDDLYGEDGDDYLFGGAGNDMLDGGEDDDVLSGQDGLDMLIGGAGNDVLDGGAGLDSLDGGSGNDFLVGGTGNNTLNGGTETIPYGPVPVENLDHIAMDRALANGDTVDYSWVEDGQGIYANDNFIQSKMQYAA